MCSCLDCEYLIICSNLFASIEERIKHLVICRTLPVAILLTVPDLDSSSFILLFPPAYEAMESTHEVCRPVKVRIVVSVSSSAIRVVVPFFSILKFIDGKSAKNFRCSHTEIGNLSHAVYKVRWCD